MTIPESFLRRSRYYLCFEYPTKIRAALEAMPPERLWWRPDEASNSAGNLLLHLAGNVRQWIVSGVGGRPDSRTRDAEFAAREGEPLAPLLERLDAVLAESGSVLDALTPDDLADTRTIQGRPTTVFEAVYHVVEHFSMHTGQLIYIAKAAAPGAVRFYEDAGGLARPTFLPEGSWEV